MPTLKQPPGDAPAPNTPAPADARDLAFRQRNPEALHDLEVGVDFIHTLNSLVSSLQVQSTTGAPSASALQQWRKTSKQLPTSKSSSPKVRALSQIAFRNLLSKKSRPNTMYVHRSRAQAGPGACCEDLQERSRTISTSQAQWRFRLPRKPRRCKEGSFAPQPTAI